jgi:hypothetical protein
MQEQVSCVHNIFLKGKEIQVQSINLRNFPKWNILKAELSL